MSDRTIREHSFDPFDWCRRCGRGRFEIRDQLRTCQPPSADILVTMQLTQIAARLPLVMASDKVMDKIWGSTS